MLALLLGAAGASAQNKIVDLSKLTDADKESTIELKDGDVLTGELDAENIPVKVVIAAPTGDVPTRVTLCNATIEGVDNPYYNWAGITCLGSATITLDGENIVRGFWAPFPGIEAGPSGTTLTIGGTGKLEATPSNKAGTPLGVGIGSHTRCGKIVITGGTIITNGGNEAAGIGTKYMSSCDDITITGGTITAAGGINAAGIGSGKSGSCGAITISSGVTKLMATKGSDSPNIIGAGKEGSCGTVTLPEGGTTSGDTYTYVGTAPSSVALTPDETHTVWTLDAMPGDNVELTAEYYPYAHVVAPKAAESVEFGTTAPLVTGGSSLGGKLMYAVTPATATAAPDPTTNASAWSENVPTADKLTFAGAAKVWYYVSGDDYHSNTAPADPVAVTITKTIAGGVPYIVATMADGWTIGDGVKAFLPQSYEYGASEITLTKLAGAPQGKVVILGNAQEDEALPAEISLVVAPDDESAVEKSYSDAFDAMDKKHFAITDGTLTLEDVIVNKNTGLTASDAIVMVLKDGKFKAVDVSQNDLGQNVKSGLLLFILSKWEYLNVGSGSGSGAGSRGIGIGGGETTRISPIDNSQLTIDNSAGAWFDMQGRRIEQPVRKGLYIRNGAKVVIK